MAVKKKVCKVCKKSKCTCDSSAPATTSKSSSSENIAAMNKVFGIPPKAKGKKAVKGKTNKKIVV